MVFWAPFL